MIKPKINFLSVILIFFFCFALCLKLYAGELNKKNNLISIGSQDALVKIKIFSSLTCPHCANFHKTVIPKIKKEFVESGKVQIIFMIMMTRKNIRMQRNIALLRALFRPQI